MHTFMDTKRQTKNQMDFAVSVGLTTIFDKGGTIKAGGWLDPATGYDPFLELLNEGQVPLRIRLFFPILDTDSSLHQLTARLNNSFREFGSDLVKTTGLGEWLIPHELQRQNPLPEFYEDALRLVAKRGWIYSQHMISLEEQMAHLDVWERVNRKIPLADLRWTIDHAYGMDQDTLNRAKALGIGVAAHSTAYLAGKAMDPGNPPFRMIIENGIPTGGGSDGARISTMNPWPMIYYMVTGKNTTGEVINPGQTISRMEAIRLWTAAQGWFSREEEDLGSIEVGKLADLVVLSDDFFDENEVPDEAIRDLSSVLTIVGGRIVHDKGILNA
jgi:predicted amidohydrolase YtcJ